ncbi:hypothetical protein CPB97_000346 [Podila verticillata]|nr:hypothetical protein CPB97_000346 [Podila verticillata]
MASSDTTDLFNRLLGNPQDNVTKAISTFVQEFETKRATSLPDPNDSLVSDLRMVPETLEDAKRGLTIDLDVTSAKAKSTAKRLEELQKVISASKGSSRLNPTLTAKETFQKDIDDAKDAFDEEMALRHADVIKQYVGTFVQQIDHY